MTQQVARVDLDPAAWSVTNDGVMGGVSSASVSAQAGALRFAGTVRLDYNGGFASIRRAWTPAAAAVMALGLRVRGDGNRYRLTLYARDAVSARAQPFTYYAVFATEPGRESALTLPLTAFVANFRGRAVPDAPALAGADLIGVGFMITRAEHSAGAGPFVLDVLEIAPRLADAPAGGAVAVQP